MPVSTSLQLISFSSWISSVFVYLAFLTIHNVFSVSRITSMLSVLTLTFQEDLFFPKTDSKARAASSCDSWSAQSASAPVVSQNHRVSEIGRDPQGSLCPTFGSPKSNHVSEADILLFALKQGQSSPFWPGRSWWCFSLGIKSPFIGLLWSKGFISCGIAFMTKPSFSLPLSSPPAKAVSAEVSQ